MENDDKITIEVDKDNLKYQFGKLILATAAGFLAQKVAENAYDKFVHHRATKTVEIKTN